MNPHPQRVIIKRTRTSIKHHAMIGCSSPILQWTSLTTSSHLTPVSLCGIQCLYWVLYGHPYLAVRPRGGLTRRYRRCGLTSRQQTIFNADHECAPCDVFSTVLMQLNLPLALLPLALLLLVPLLLPLSLLLVALPLIL